MNLTQSEKFTESFSMHFPPNTSGKNYCSFRKYKIWKNAIKEEPFFCNILFRFDRLWKLIKGNHLCLLLVLLFKKKFKKQMGNLIIQNILYCSVYTCIIVKTAKAWLKSKGRSLIRLHKNASLLLRHYVFENITNAIIAFMV